MNNGLAGRLVKLRDSMGLNQKEMAAKMNVSERVYRRYEKEEQVPGSDKLMALLGDVKDLNPGWLIAGENRMFRSETVDVSEDVLAAVKSHPPIKSIVLMLAEMDDADVQDVLARTRERKELREMKETLRSLTQTTQQE